MQRQDAARVKQTVRNEVTGEGGESGREGGVLSGHAVSSLIRSKLSCSLEHINNLVRARRVSLHLRLSGTGGKGNQPTLLPFTYTLTGSCKC